MNLFDLYEQSVQSPEFHVDFFSKIYQKIKKKLPHELREDFCGTHLICSQWAKKHTKNFALGLDLDHHALSYGQNRDSQLPKDILKRIQTCKTNVLNPPKKKFDLITVCNFSFFIFKNSTILGQYFKTVAQSLKPNGLFILETVTGSGMLENVKEVTRKKGFTYIWEQKKFNLLTHEGEFAIHFKINHKTIKNAFTYYWRLWSIPEITHILTKAGFSKIHFFIEERNNPKNVTRIDPHYAVIVYIVAEK